MPFPINASDKWANGAKSPEAPREPDSYITGKISLLKKKISCS